MRALSYALVLLMMLAFVAGATEPLPDASGEPADPVVPDNEWNGEQLSLDEGVDRVQTFLDSLGVHEPIYFLAGIDPGLEQSKFQLSLKYRMFSPEGWLGENMPWLSGFHIAYTQRSVWDLESASKPFDDTSYMPEMFYQLSMIDLDTADISAFGLQTGFQHESNGKGGADSRSTNYVYFKPILGIHLFGPFHLKLAPKVFAYVANEDETNEDLKDYRGYVDVEASIIDPDGFALTSHTWWAKKGNSVQLDLTYPMDKMLDLNFYLHAQFFSGYAETLLHYQERHDVFRLGVSIVR